ncbi:hypothetical protein GUJ93_ZPchr0884g33588 [Zizania palustris]|uniref:Uncharacterized protein n=1 Tax=Zizania palustris TaxID=103762 RepID=A0A8J5QXJ4_ZIZPA|nr:hypothetical protein GUJ93_ZPchr0884g33588 [Zizania palustris]
MDSSTGFALASTTATLAENLSPLHSSRPELTPRGRKELTPRRAPPPTSAAILCPRVLRSLSRPRTLRRRPQPPRASTPACSSAATLCPRALCRHPPPAPRHRALYRRRLLRPPLTPRALRRRPLPPRAPQLPSARPSVSPHHRALRQVRLHSGPSLSALPCAQAPRHRALSENEQKVGKTLKYAISQMQDICKKLQETASFCYMDEDHADGSLMTGVARRVDELAEILDQTSLNCQVELMDPNSLLESGYRSEDSAVWADVSLDEELDTMSKAQTLGEHCVMYDLDFEEMWDRAM